MGQFIPDNSKNHICGDTAYILNFIIYGQNTRDALMKRAPLMFWVYIWVKIWVR